MEKSIMLLSKLIKINILLCTDDAYKLKEPTITDETEIEIEIEVLNLYSIEVSAIPNTQAMMAPQLLDIPQTHTSSTQYQQYVKCTISTTRS